MYKKLTQSRYKFRTSPQHIRRYLQTGNKVTSEFSLEREAEQDSRIEGRPESSEEERGLATEVDDTSRRLKNQRAQSQSCT